jgi:hypothetical protein
LAGDFESVAHARQQSVELLVAEVDLVGEELADARLVYATEIPLRVEYQLTPAGARLEVVLATMAAWAEQDLPRSG